MTQWGRRVWGMLLAMTLVLAVLPLGVGAGNNDPLVINGDVLVTTRFPAPDAPHSLMLQATSWPGTPYRYALLVGNFSPWTINSLRVLDRYFSTTSERLEDEVALTWSPAPLEPGQTATFVSEFPGGAFIKGGCHQIELNIAAGLYTILMDCSAPGATTVWNVPLREDAAARLDVPVQTQSQAVGRSKLGVHVNANSSPKIMEFVRQTHPAVVVAVGDLGWLAEVKAVSPKTITIGRLLEGDQTIGGDPVARARDYVQANVALYRVHPGVDYWLGWNEPTIDSVAQMQWFAAFEAERAAAMAELGFKVAIGNFSAGTPEADEFQAFTPALVAARKVGGILALHEYAAPDMRSGVGSRIPGLSTYYPEAGSLTLRYRNWYNTAMLPGDAFLPIVITETGIDGGVLQGARTASQGWRDFLAADSPSQPSPAAIAAYLDQLSWYDDELRRDPQVLGAAVFCAGARGQWQSFDITEVLPQLADLVNSKH